MANEMVEPGKKTPATIQDLLERADTQKKFAMLAPRHLSPERLLRTMAMAVYKVPKLKECTPGSLLGAMMASASLGLEPNTPLGHAYLIPFKGRRKNRDGQWIDVMDVQLIIGYRGFIDLARRSGTMVSIHADVVFGPSGSQKGDEFSFEYGSDMHLRHKPIGLREGRPAEWAYAHAKLVDGQAFEVLPYANVLKIRDATQGYRTALAVKREKGENHKGWLTAPWVAFEHEMAAKTMVRRLAKWLPLSLEFANAAALDQMSEAGKADFSKFADDPETAIIDAEAIMQEGPESETSHDLETGEVIDGKKPEGDAPKRGRPAGTKSKPKDDPNTPEGRSSTAREAPSADSGQGRDAAPAEHSSPPAQGKPQEAQRTLLPSDEEEL